MISGKGPIYPRTMLVNNDFNYKTFKVLKKRREITEFYILNREQSP
jgi:hypothetical protein